MSAAFETSRLAADDLETAADQAIADCGGDAREAVKALIVANNFLEARVARLQASVIRARTIGSAPTGGAPTVRSQLKRYRAPFTHHFVPVLGPTTSVRADPWRFSDAGRRSAWIASSCRHPKTSGGPPIGQTLVIALVFGFALEAIFLLGRQRDSPLLARAAEAARVEAHMATSTTSRSVSVRADRSLSCAAWMYMGKPDIRSRHGRKRPHAWRGRLSVASPFGICAKAVLQESRLGEDEVVQGQFTCPVR
jgi:hypothetical protein